MWESFPYDILQIIGDECSFCFQLTDTLWLKDIYFNLKYELKIVFIGYPIVYQLRHLLEDLEEMKDMRERFS